jgi:hypothetical protein
MYWWGRQRRSWVQLGGPELIEGRWRGEEGTEGFFVFVFCGAMGQTQGLTHVRQVLNTELYPQLEVKVLKENER